MFSSYSYRELQTALKAHRAAGIETIALNSKKAALVAELERIEASLVEPPAPVVTTWKETAIAWFHRRVLPVLPRRIAVGFALMAELRGMFGKFRAAWEETDRARARAIAG